MLLLPSRLERAVIDTSAALGRCMISVQSIGEFYIAARRRSLMPVPNIVQAARDFMGIFAMFGTDEGDSRTSLETVARHQLPCWDALLLATAARAGCRALLSEDMQDGFTLGGVTVCNPFIGDDLPPRVAELLQS